MTLRLPGALAILLLLPCAAWSQADKGTILGTVLDTSGAPAPETSVKVTEVNTNIVHETKTNDTGNYSFPLLDPGTYTVDSEHSGFKRESRKDVRLEANSTVRVDFSLQVGSVTNL